MDNNLLKQLIAQHRRVVIPDFGAFLKKGTPDGEELVFSPFLRKDDGVVTDTVCNEYGVEAEDARAMTAEFVVYLRQTLAVSGKYHIDGVGTLVADANGVVSLKKNLEPETRTVEAEPSTHAQERQPAPRQVPQTSPDYSKQSAGQVAPNVQPGQTTRPQSIQVREQGTVQPVQSVQQPYPQQTTRYVQRPAAPERQPFPRTQSPVRQPVPPRAPNPLSQPGQFPRNNPPPPQSAHGQAPAGGNGMPPRGPQNSVQAQRTAPNGGSGQPRRRAVPPRAKPQKTKTDVWLIIAIIAALIVIAILVYSFINTGKGDIDMDAIRAAMTPQDTVTLIDDLEP